MKTSTKIFMGLAAAAVAMCVVNVFVGVAINRKHDVEARRILAGLEAGPVGTLVVSLSPELDPDVTGMFRSVLNARNTQSGGEGQQLFVPAWMLDDIRIDGGTMYMEVDGDGSAYHLGRMWRFLSSPSLTKIVIREPGRGDEVIEIVPEVEPEAVPDTVPDTAPEAVPDTGA